MPTFCSRKSPWLCALMLLTCLLAPTATGHAQSPEDREAARKHSAEGAKLMQQGKLEQAVDAFQHAYERHQDPRYQYNIGVALKALGKDAAALAAFERFLADAQQVPPEFLADARKQKDALAQKVGTLEVVSTQDNARVTIDGRESGVTPLSGGFKLDPGSYLLRLEKPGFESYQENVRIGIGKITRVEVALQPIPRAPEAVVEAAPEPVAPTPRLEPASEVAQVQSAASRSTDSDETLAFAAGSVALGVGAGVTTFLSGVPSGTGASATVSFIGDVRMWQQAQGPWQFSLGGEAALAFLSEGDRQMTLTSLLLNPTVHALVSPRFSLFARLGLGLLVLGGLETPSRLVSDEATGVTGALSAWEVRPSVGGSYALDRRLSLFLGLGLAFSPRPDPAFREASLTRFTSSAGMQFHF